MSTKIRVALAMLIFHGQIHGQESVTIGTTRAKLEINSHAVFGNGAGIGIGGNSIGFNAAYGSYLSNGYASIISAPNSPATPHGFSVYTISSGIANSPLSPSNLRLNLAGPLGNRIMTTSTLPNGVLDVGRGNGVNGTAQFTGTTYSSHFNYSSNEDTYIRGGLSGSRVIFENAGDMFIGNGSSVVGVNYNNPVYTFEMRQSGGTGFQMGLTSYPWEWRVSGSPANFYARYQGSIKTYFSPSNGTLNPVSDRRLKTDIKPLEDVLGSVIQLNPVSYLMRLENPSKIRSIGFLAQEVQELFPYLINEKSDSTNTLMVNYSGFSVLAVKALQEEEELIRSLESKTQQAYKILFRIEEKLNRKQ